MKKPVYLLALLLAAALTSALGPVKKLHVLTWTPSPSEGVTGYWLYWRTGTAGYSDTNRASLSTNSNTFDLLLLRLPPAVYFLAATATNAIGDESYFSEEIAWDAGPKAPKLTGVTP